MQSRGEATFQEVGCTREVFKGWIQQQFSPGQSWDNYGRVWQIDHILPQSWFRRLPRERDLLMNHYKNLRPLDASHNLRRLNRMTQADLSFVMSNLPDALREAAWTVVHENMGKLEIKGPDLPPTQGPHGCTC